MLDKEVDVEVNQEVDKEVANEVEDFDVEWSQIWNGERTVKH